MSEAPLDLQAVEAHLAELRELHRLPFSETAPRDAIDQARAIELGQALRLADVLLAELRSVRVAAGAGDPRLPRMPNETLRELLHEGIEEVYHWEDHVLAKQLALWLEARGVVIQRGAGDRPPDPRELRDYARPPMTPYPEGTTSTVRVVREGSVLDERPPECTGPNFHAEYNDLVATAEALAAEVEELRGDRPPAPSAHTVIDFALDEIIRLGQEARPFVDEVAIAKHRGAIHDAVRAVRPTPRAAAIEMAQRHLRDAATSGTFAEILASCHAAARCLNEAAEGAASPAAAPQEEPK